MIAAIKHVLLSPRAEKFHRAQKFPLTPRLKGLSGKAICLVDNRRPNAQPLMDSIAEALARDYPDAKLTRFRKDVAASSINDAMLERIQTEYQAVVEALCS